MSPVKLIVWICVVVLAATAVITLLALTGKLKLGRTDAAHDDYLKQLFRALVVQVIVISVGGAFASYVSKPETETTPPTVPPNAERIAEHFDIIIVAGGGTSGADSRGRPVFGLPALANGASHADGSSASIKIVVPLGRKIVEPVSIFQDEAQLGTLADFIVNARVQDGTLDSILIKGYAQTPNKELSGSPLSFLDRPEMKKPNQTLEPTAPSGRGSS